MFVFDKEELSKRLIKGSAALLPTDTLPALAACPEHASQLWALKKRPSDKPLILLGSCVEDFFDLILPSAFEDARSMAKCYWPGALTMVLPCSGDVVEALNPGAKTLGIRIPDCSMTRDLIGSCGPLATTSANIAGESSSLNAEEASACFPELPLLGPLPWPASSGLASTVISWEGPGSWQSLRIGAVIPESFQ